MPYSQTGRLADPEFRRDRARKAGASRTTVAYHVTRIVERAAELTADQRTALNRAMRLSRAAVERGGAA
jgi:hypothetical protein